MKQGIIPAIEQLFPAAEHRFCLRHIHQNMKLKWNGTAFKDLLWKCATALTIPQFDAAMTEMKTLSKDCHEWLCKIPPKHWARAHFSGK